MKLSISQFKKSSGFTLIELLVVIAIIGILAAALIATIDPLEQIRKAQDTTRKNTAVEYVSSITRFYGTHQLFPWNAPTSCNGGAEPLVAPIDSLGDCTDAMITEAELKAAFRDAGAVLTEVSINYDVAANRLTGCFVPQSRSGQTDPAARYTTADGSDNSCVPAVGSGCFWCAQ